jgi:hypothetical protein
LDRRLLLWVALVGGGEDAQHAVLGSVTAVDHVAGIALEGEGQAASGGDGGCEDDDSKQLLHGFLLSV